MFPLKCTQLCPKQNDLAGGKNSLDSFLSQKEQGFCNRKTTEIPDLDALEIKKFEKPNVVIAFDEQTDYCQAEDLGMIYHIGCKPSETFYEELY